MGINVFRRKDKLFQDSYNKVWKKIQKDLERWSKLKLSWLGKISVIKMSILPERNFLCPKLPTVIHEKKLKDWQKQVRLFGMARSQELRVKVLQDEKKRATL